MKLMDEPIEWRKIENGADGRLQNRFVGAIRGKDNTRGNDAIAVGIPPEFHHQMYSGIPERTSNRDVYRPTPLFPYQYQLLRLLLRLLLRRRNRKVKEQHEDLFAFQSSQLIKLFFLH